MGPFIILGILVVVGLLIIISNVHIVPQSKAFVVERLGAYHQTWKTGLHIKIPFFDRIAKHAGAGTLVPITGFANAVASPAIDAHSEGLILGVGAKIFTVAGPVLLYGTLAGAIYGVIYWLSGLM